MNPTTFLPGASRAFVLEYIGGISIPKPAFDKKGRPLWNMPEPKYQVLHYKTAGAKAKWSKIREDIEGRVKNGEKISEFEVNQLRNILKEATKVVPIYAGCDARQAQAIRRAERFSRAMDEAEQMNWDFDYDAAIKENEAYAKTEN